MRRLPNERPLELDDIARYRPRPITLADYPDEFLEAMGHIQPMGVRSNRAGVPAGADEACERIRAAVQRQTYGGPAPLTMPDAKATVGYILAGLIIGGLCSPLILRLVEAML